MEQFGPSSVPSRFKKNVVFFFQVLDDQIGFEVRWAIAGKSIVTQLVARLNEGQYMAFGLSGEEDRSRSGISRWNHHKWFQIEPFPPQDGWWGRNCCLDGSQVRDTK